MSARDRPVRAAMLRGHVARAGFLASFLAVWEWQREIEIGETNSGIAGDRTFSGLKSRCMKPPFMDMLEARAHVDDDVADIIEENGVNARCT